MSNILTVLNSNSLEIAVNKHSNLLIIGKASTNYCYNTITYCNDYNNVLNNYGDSDLSNAFKIAQDNGVEDIFLLNIKSNDDYFLIIETLKQNDFTYIAPINTLLSDYYYDKNNNNKKTYYAEYLLKEINNNDSIFIFTDKHANLYEDQLAYLKDMNFLSKEITNNVVSSKCKENLIFVANNLKNYTMSNLILAIALCTTDISLYPTSNFGPALFLIDQYDDTYNFAYFKNHTDIDTTVENLLNFKDVSIEKIVTVQRIIKMIKREMNFSEFHGRLYNEYQRLLIYKKIEKYLSSLLDYVIYNYDIISIDPYKDPNNPCTIIVVCILEVWPKNCLEKCSIKIGVEVG